mmetsp:Transcript_35698/g.94586  ORF Transcript_35698/g.94586 Transcript_35698/m.94586 type:complete len:337 (-) Transcript_35698:212-1222(-)
MSALRVAQDGSSGRAKREQMTLRMVGALDDLPSTTFRRFAPAALEIGEESQHVSPETTTTATTSGRSTTRNEARHEALWSARSTSSSVMAPPSPPAMPPIPRCMRCPISQKLMVTPAVAADGAIYERDNILSWFRAGNATSPVTHNLLPTQEVHQVSRLKDMIEEYLKLRDNVQQQQTEWREYIERREHKANRKLAQSKMYIQELKVSLALNERRNKALERDLGEATGDARASRVNRASGDGRMELLSTHGSPEGPRPDPGAPTPWFTGQAPIHPRTPSVDQRTPNRWSSMPTLLRGRMRRSSSSPRKASKQAMPRKSPGQVVELGQGGVLPNVEV